MEKTLKILKQESYVEGYNDAREAISREIENTTIFYPHIGINGLVLEETTEIMADLRTRYARIAKGEAKPVESIEPKPCFFCNGEGILLSGELCSCFTKVWQQL